MADSVAPSRKVLRLCPSILECPNTGPKRRWLATGESTRAGFARVLPPLLLGAWRQPRHAPAQSGRSAVGSVCLVYALRDPFRARAALWKTTGRRPWGFASRKRLPAWHSAGMVSVRVLLLFEATVLTATLRLTRVVGSRHRLACRGALPTSAPVRPTSMQAGRWLQAISNRRAKKGVVWRLGQPGRRGRPDSRLHCRGRCESP